ncbi:MAG: PQQ-binding-like beta-propeller repeat protein, partial [Polyangiaceae bacterium]|nr:PQQ-binding-like beta-propeller repeat protein [Polyangiaceae bacterium]
MGADCGGAKSGRRGSRTLQWVSSLAVLSLGCSLIAPLDNLAAAPKFCNGTDVGRSDPRFGCGAEACSPCQSAGNTPTCNAGVCAVGACETGKDSCDGITENGCETKLLEDPNNCGRCGSVCATGLVCSDGKCAAGCELGKTACSGSCVDTQTSLTHCGACAQACGPKANANATCTAGVCTLPCTMGFAQDGTGACIGGLQPGSPWPMFMRDLRHTGQSGSLTNLGTKKWEFESGGNLVNAAVIAADGTIYIGSYTEKKLFALNPDGTKKWEFVTVGQVASAPAIGADGAIYFGSTEGKFYALNPDGSKRWEFQTIGAIGSSAAIANDGTIYFGCADTSLYALLPSGTKKWSFKAIAEVVSAPAVDAAGVVYFDSGGTLFAVNPDGTKRWSYDSGASDVLFLTAPSVAVDGTVYFGNVKNFVLTAVDASGTKKWEFPTAYHA